MAYTPTNWEDRVVDNPRTYDVQNNPDGTITLIPKPGVVHQSGTPVNASNMNNIEEGISEKVSKSGDTMTDDLRIYGGVYPSKADATSSAAPDTYPPGMSMIRLDGGTANGWPVNYGVVVTFVASSYIRSYQLVVEKTSAKQFIRSVNSAGSEWEDWQQIITSSTIRTSNGYLEYNDGSEWMPVGLIANKPRTADLEQSDATQNTWYTVVNVSSGKGRLTRISAASTHSTILNNDIEVRITIDGSAVIHSPTLSNLARGLQHLNSTDGMRTVDIWLNSEFLSSMKVEVRQTRLSSTNSAYLTAAVDYALT